MKTNTEKKKNIILLYGAIASFLVNFPLYQHDKQLPFIISIDFLYFLILPICAISIFCRSILRGKVTYNKWGIEQAKEIIETENGFIRKSLARMYLLVYNPILFLGGWAMGTGVFYLIVSY